MNVVYSFYIDIPDDRLVNDKPYQGDTINKNVRTKLELTKWKKWLIDKQRKYAESINAEYLFFEYDDQYKRYAEWFHNNFPDVNEYCIVNFYKIHLLYELADKYEKVLYLDLDAIPVTRENFFDQNLNENGIGCKFESDGQSERYFARATDQHYHRQREKGFNLYSDRSPEAKYWNCRAMLVMQGHSGKNNVFNTGIIGATKEHLDCLGYFDDFKDTLSLMTDLREDDGFFPSHIVRSFGYDNETVFSYKMNINSVKRFNLNDWHFPYHDLVNYIPKQSKIVHMIAKRFDVLEKYCEKNNI